MHASCFSSSICDILCLSLCQFSVDLVSVGEIPPDVRFLPDYATMLLELRIASWKHHAFSSQSFEACLSVRVYIASRSWMLIPQFLSYL